MLFPFPFPAVWIFIPSPIPFRTEFTFTPKKIPVYHSFNLKKSAFVPIFAGFQRENGNSECPPPMQTSTLKIKTDAVACIMNMNLLIDSEAPQNLFGCHNNDMTEAGKVCLFH